MRGRFTLKALNQTRSWLVGHSWLQNHLFPGAFGEFFFAQGDFVGSNMSSVLILMNEDKSRGVDGGGGGRGGGGDRARIGRIEESYVDDV